MAPSKRIPSPDGLPWYIAPMRRRGFRGALREFVTLVFDVLVALAGQAWWQDYQRHRDEDRYLRQLVADFEAIDARLDEAMIEEDLAGATTARILAAIQSGDSIPFDTLRAWMSPPRWPFWYAEVRFVMGTITALQNTGDLNLVEDDSLRAIVSAFVGDMDAEKEEFGRWVDMSVDAYRTFFDQSSRQVPDFPLGDDADELATRGALFLQAMLDEPALRAILTQLQNARRNRVFYLDRMKRETYEMQRMLTPGG